MWATADPLELLLHLEPGSFLREHWARRPAEHAHTRDRRAGLFDEDARLRCIEPGTGVTARPAAQPGMSL